MFDKTKSLFSRNQTAVAAALFALCLAAVWRKLLFYGLVPVDGNLLTLFYPPRMFFRAAMAAHSLPLWNQYKSMGEPLLADPQAMMLYPPAWLAFMLPYARQAQFWTVFHAALLFFFVYKSALLVCGKNKSAAFSAALFVTFNPLVLAKATLLIYTAALSWLAAALYFFMTENSAGFTLSLALFWLAGFPSYFIIAALLLGAAALTEGKEKLLFLIKGYALALAVCAAQILPFLQMLLNSTRGVSAGDTGGMFSSTPGNLLMQLFVPPYIKIPDFAFEDPAVLSFYVGIPALALAACAAFKGGKKEKLGALLACVLFALALGPRTHVYTLLPFNALFRFPAHWLMPSMFIISLLCARGLALLENRKLALALGVLFCADMFCAALSYSSCAWGKPEFFTDIPALATNAVPAGEKVYHTQSYMQAVARRPLAEDKDYMRIRETFLPSYGAALGLREVRSHQIMRSKKYSAYMLRLEAAKNKKTLLDNAGIALVIDARETATGPETVFYRNATARPLVWYDAQVPPPAYESGTNSLRIASVLDQPQRLVIGQINYPGWRAYVDGKQTVIEDFDGTFLSVLAPGGAHAIEFKYRPAGFYIGLFISLIALAWLVWQLAQTVMVWVLLRRWAAATLPPPL